MIVALDVHYTDTEAHAAALVFSDWNSTQTTNEQTAIISPVSDYEPGKFYMRELAPLLKVIEKIDDPVETYIVDGYCHLSSDLEPGLGAYLQEALPGQPTIIGVAKNRFRHSQHAMEVYRSGSNRPLFVTSIEIDYSEAAKMVESMAGEFRIPRMLKAVDRVARLKAKM